MSHNNRKFRLPQSENHEANGAILKNKITIPIKGMHCRSCEILIEEKLKEIPAVKSVSASYRQGHAIVFSEKALDLFETNSINKVIQNAGYEIGTDAPKNWLSHDPIIWKDAALALIFLTILYFVAKNFGLFNLKIGNTSNPSNLAVVLVIGLTAGFSTCMALVGGLVLGISAKFSEKHPEATTLQKFRPHLFFNLGRIIAYFLLGGIIGMIGKAFQLSGSVMGSLLILVGIVMIIVGAQLTGLFPKLASISFSMPSGISKFFGLRNQHKKEYSHTNSMVTGALTFFLPCGFTQAMQLFAMSTGNFWSGALIMVTFALGTAPGLLGIGGLTSVVRGAFARRFFKGAGILVIALALFNISNGLNLSGLSTKFVNAFSKGETNAEKKADPNVVLVDGVQVVRMYQDSAGYTPNTFTIEKGIPVRWIVTSRDSSTCAASLYSQKIGVRKLLKAGENIIEFTPTDLGKIPFSCSMGMYRGSFDVVERSSQNITPIAGDEDTVQPSASSPASDKKAETPSLAADSSPISPKSPAIDEQIAPRTSTPEPVVQIVKATYTYKDDISPKNFTVKANQPVKFEIDVQEDGSGCMSSIVIPDLVDDYQILQKGIPIIFDFTPPPGEYQITCAMGVPRATITAK